MHVLVVIYKTGAEYQFFFKDKEKARKFKRDYAEPSKPHAPADLFLVIDEHGKEGAFDISMIAGVIVIDLEGKVDAEIEANLLTLRGDARMKNAVIADPFLAGISNLMMPGKK